MRSATRALLATATSLALAAGMLAIDTSPAAALPTAPVISSITSNAGTFSSSPAAGTQTAPQITVTGVASGDTVTLLVNNVPQAGTCAANSTSVTFNNPSGNCTPPANVTVGTTDGSYSITAVRTNGGGASPVSDPFDYILDRTAPPQPGSPTAPYPALPTATPKAGAAIEVAFGTVLDQANPVASGVTKYTVYRSQRDPTGGVDDPTTVYSPVGTVLASACTGGQCKFLDTPANVAADPSNGHQYFYKVTATDAAANEGARSNGSASVVADGSPPPAPTGVVVTPSTANHDAGWGNDTKPLVTVTLSATEQTTVQLLVNNVAVGSAQSVSSGVTTWSWNDNTLGHDADFGSDGAKSVTVSATDVHGNTATSAATIYNLDTLAPAAPTIDSVINEAGSPINGNDTTPQVAISGVVANEHGVLTVDKVDPANATPTSYEQVSSGAGLVFDHDSCETIAPACQFTITGAGPRHINLTASARDRAGNTSSSNPVVDYYFSSLGPATSKIESMGNPVDAATPASGTDRTPPMVVSTTSDAVRIDIFKGTGTSPIGSAPVSGHTVPCPAGAVGAVCVGLNQTSTATDFTVSSGANILKARAVDAFGNVKDSDTFEWDALDTLAPPVPSTPTAVLSANGGVAVDWGDVTDGPDGSGNSSNPVTYTLQRAGGPPVSGACPAAGSLVFANVATGLTTSNYSDTVSPINNCFYYRVKAVDGASNSSSFSTASSAVGDITPPPVPNAPVGTLGSGGSVSLDWNDVTDSFVNPVTYNVYRASASPTGTTCPSSSGLTFTSIITGRTTSDATDTVSPANRCYYYKVTAIDAATNESAQSTASAAVGDVTPPPAVSKPTVAKLSIGHLAVSWSAVTDPAPASSPVTYAVLRGTANPGTAGNQATCPAASGVTFSTLATGLTSTSYEDDATTNGKCTYYEITASDANGNSAAPSPSSDAALVDTSSAPPTPSITSVNGSTSNPVYASGAGSDTPTVVISVAEAGGVVQLFADATLVASKAVAAVGPVTLSSGDYTTGIGSRTHSLTAVQVVNGKTSAASGSVTYVRPPAAPTITSVGGITTSPAKQAATRPTVVASWSGGLATDSASLYIDSDCAGPTAPVLVVTKTNQAGTATFSGTGTNGGDWGSTTLAKGVTYCITVTVTDTTISDAPTASATSIAFVFERAPIVKGFALDAYGSVTPLNDNAVTTLNSPIFSFQIARSLVELPDGTGGYELDGWGGIHPWAVSGNALPPNLSGGPYWYGWDIARDMALLPGATTKGYVLDGWGGVHPFGGAPAVRQTGYWSGWDIARRLVLLPDGSGGYVLDGWGGLHPFATGTNAMPPDVSGGPYWSGWDIARDVVLTGATKGYVLDGWGGVHQFGGAPAAATTGYTAGSDQSKALAVTETDLDGGYVLDGFARVSLFGDALVLPQPTRRSASVMRDMTLITS